MALKYEDLCRQIKKGNRQAFAELYDRYEPALFRYSLHVLGNSQLAKEVTCEVFSRLARSDVRYELRQGTLGSYLYGVARAVMPVARRKSTFGRGRDWESRHEIQGDLITNEHTAALYAALRRLPDHYRDALVLCDLEGRSYEGVAALMNCSPGTVCCRVRRARKLLTLRLSARAGELPCAEPEGRNNERSLAAQFRIMRCTAAQHQTRAGREAILREFELAHRTVIGSSIQWTLNNLAKLQRIIARETTSGTGRSPAGITKTEALDAARGLST